MCSKERIHVFCFSHVQSPFRDCPKKANVASPKKDKASAGVSAARIPGQLMSDCLRRETQHPEKPRMLDFFSGTGSVSDYFRRQRYQVESMDMNPKSKPTILTDILGWNYRVYPPGYFDIIAASPPCEEYSAAKTTAPRDFERSDKIVRQTLISKSLFPTQGLVVGKSSVKEVEE